MIYESTEAKVNFCQLYIMLTILLILSQDEVNNNTMQKIVSNLAHTYVNLPQRDRLCTT